MDNPINREEVRREALAEVRAWLLAFGEKDDKTIGTYRGRCSAVTSMLAIEMGIAFAEQPLPQDPDEHEVGDKCDACGDRTSDLRYNVFADLGGVCRKCAKDG